MTTRDELVATVDEAFALTGRGLAPWPDPHPDRSAAQEEYSRLTDPTKWRIVGARADAWVRALRDTGLADLQTDVDVRWRVLPRTVVTRTDRAVPRAVGGLPLVVGRSRLGSVDDAGVTLGAGDPAVPVVSIPDCGCDACDSGSQDVLDELDEYVFGIVSGAFRRLYTGDREITALGGSRWSASGRFDRGEVAAILADPVGWQEVTGVSWMKQGDG